MRNSKRRGRGAPEPTLDELVAVEAGPRRPASTNGRGRAGGSSGAGGPADIEIRPGGGRLGELLLQMNVVDTGQVVHALQQQQSSGKRLGAVLVELGALDERHLAAALSQQLDVPMADLRTGTPEPDAIALMSETVARANLAIPMRVTDSGVEVVVADPSEETGTLLTEAVGRRVHLLVAPASDVQRAIDQSYRALGGVDRLVKAFEVTDAGRRTDVGETSVLTDDAPIVQVVNLIVTQALRDRASDVHIEPQDDQVRVRFRIDGALHDAISLPAGMAPALVSRIKILAGMNIVERRRPQDGQITTEVDGRSLDIRVSTLATIWGEKCVMRLLDKSRRLYKLHDLGMPDDTHDTFSKLVRYPFGMVLCAGPTGSGKTTTLYATLAEINEPQRNIMTVEDPVEYVFPSINQIQTNEQAGLNFATGLKSILRQDPDVILLGEIRDVETARIATQSALTGHFVLSSLHATDSVAALHRFLDMGIESFLIASSVVGIVGQRLVRRTCPSCAEPYQPTDEELVFYEEAGGEPKTDFFAGVGCNFCADTGYQDRIGVYELLTITPEIKRLIVGWATQDELRRLAVSQGMRTLSQEAVALVEQDVTTISEVIRTIYAF